MPELLPYSAAYASVATSLTSNSIASGIPWVQLVATSTPWISRLVDDVWTVIAEYLDVIDLLTGLCLVSHRYHQLTLRLFKYKYHLSVSSFIREYWHYKYTGEIRLPEINVVQLDGFVLAAYEFQHSNCCNKVMLRKNAVKRGRAALVKKLDAIGMPAYYYQSSYGRF